MYLGLFKKMIGRPFIGGQFPPYSHEDLPYGSGIEGLWGTTTCKLPTCNGPQQFSEQGVSALVLHTLTFLNLINAKTLILKPQDPNPQPYHSAILSLNPKTQ